MEDDKLDKVIEDTVYNEWQMVCSICHTKIDQSMITCPGCNGIIQWGWLRR